VQLCACSSFKYQIAINAIPGQLIHISKCTGLHVNYNGHKPILADPSVRAS
jgi:hypothetical protein